MSRKEKIRVITKEPGMDPKIEVIDNELHTLQDKVHGYIEAVPIMNRDVIMIVNEDGKWMDLRPNFWYGENRDDLIVGTAIFCGSDGEEFTDVPERFEQTLLQLLAAAGDQVDVEIEQVRMGGGVKSGQTA